MSKIYRRITASLVSFALVMVFASASFAALVESSLEFPMTIWGALMNSSESVPAGATVNFINLDPAGNFKIADLTTTVAGKFGGDSAYDTNIALPEFTENLVLQILTGERTFTLDADDLTAAIDNPEDCSSTDALAFVSQTCRSHGSFD